MSESTTQHGYLLLADISGYTSFVAGTELEHAQDILSELLEVILLRFKTCLTIAKLEGDAVFAHAPQSSIPRGEVILELVESTYVAFRDKREAAHRRTTCTCNACRAIPSLDLKFIIHHGDYFVQNIMGTKELVGTDVNLIHRLLKNHVAEQTGWKAYAMFTAQVLAHLSVQTENWLPINESYEHIGEVNTLNLNLHERYDEIVSVRRVFILPEAAHVVLNYDYGMPQHLIWEWFNDPIKRGLWMSSEIVPVIQIKGRNTAGARNHCVHGKNEIVVEDVLDIRPFDYFTVRHTPQGTSTSLSMTFRFTQLDPDHTHLCLTFRANLPRVLRWLEKGFCRFIVKRTVLTRWKLDKIDGIAKEFALPPSE